MSFKPMHNLDQLSEVEREQYYVSACEYFQVPPELRLLEFMWLDTGDGKRNLVLYAKKGATDVIRASQEISVTSTTRADGPGYVAFIVEGKGDNGRTEQAVGSASILNLTGQALANAVMIAHTRATRRMTLQFAGGGLLDESELHGALNDISRSGASLASLATLPTPIQPGTAPNTAAGTDITKPEGEWVEVSRKVVYQDSETKEDITKLKMVAPLPFSGGSIIPEAVEQITETSQPIPEKKRRPGRKKSEIVMDVTAAEQFFPAPYLGPEQVSPSGDISESQQTATPEPVIEVPKESSPDIKSRQNVSGSVPAVPVPEIAINPDMPTDEEVKAFKSELTQYTERNGVLNQGGLTENVFGKIRLYTMSLFPDAEVLPSKAIRLTKTQWRTLLETFKRIVTEAGPAGLVNVIEGTNK